MTAVEVMNENIQKILVEIKCEKCGGETRVNSYDELWCKNCAMLVYACKCNLTKENHTHESLDVVYSMLRYSEMTLDQKEKFEIFFGILG